MRWLALTGGFIDFRAVLGQPNTDLGEFFDSTSLGIYSLHWKPYLPLRMVDFLKAGDDRERLVSQFSAVGEYLDYRPTLPWCVVKSDSPLVSKRELEHLSSVQVSVDPLTYLGLAAVICIVLEIDDRPLKYHAALEGLVPDLAAYIMSRWGYEATESLQDLPIPDHFRGVFRQWATGSVNFSRVGDQPVAGLG